MVRTFLSCLRRYPGVLCAPCVLLLPFTLDLEAMDAFTVYLEGMERPLLLIQQVFTDEDGSTGIRYLVTSDITLEGNGIAAIYQKRWNVEPYYKSLKQNASLEKSPT